MDMAAGAGVSFYIASPGTVGKVPGMPRKKGGRGGGGETLSRAAPWPWSRTHLVELLPFQRSRLLALPLQSGSGHWPPAPADCYCLCCLLGGGEPSCLEIPFHCPGSSNGLEGCDQGGGNLAKQAPTGQVKVSLKS